MSVIYLLRHGEVAGCRPHRFIGRSDLPLTAGGKRQIASMAEYLSGHSIAQVVSSPLVRCRQSAELICDKLGVSMRVVPELAEIDLGGWEGLSIEEVEERFPGQYAARGENIAEYRPEHGESFQDLLDRAWPAFNELITPFGQCTVIISHAGVNRVLLCHMLGMPLAHIFYLNQHYGCLNIIHHQENGFFRVQCVNLSPELLQTL